MNVLSVLLSANHCLPEQPDQKEELSKQFHNCLGAQQPSFVTKVIDGVVFTLFFLCVILEILAAFEKGAK